MSGVKLEDRAGEVGKINININAGQIGKIIDAELVGEMGTRAPRMINQSKMNKTGWYV